LLLFLGDRWRLYLVRGGGSHAEETSLVQVPCSTRQLRSRTCLLLLDTRTGHLWVWHGSQSHSSTRSAALSTANWLNDTKPEEFGLTSTTEIKITEVKEGYETEEFFAGEYINVAVIY
jgi:supervillin